MIFDASKEIRSSIVNATLIILMVFIPLFFLSGVEGRLLKPLGISYMVSIGASLIVALTVTPALCSYLLPRAKCPEREEDGAVMERLQRLYRPVLDVAVNRPALVIAGSVLAFALAMVPLALTGRSFLPAFNEGALTVVAFAGPGTALEQSAEIGRQIEAVLLKHPTVAAGLALIPFAIAADKPGNEILSPMAVVILGGLLSATILNMVVLPSLYLKFGARQQ